MMLADLPHLADDRPGRAIANAGDLTSDPTEEQGRRRPEPRRRAYRGATKFASPLLQARNRSWLSVKKLFGFATDVALAEFLNRPIRTVRDAMAWCEANPAVEDDGRDCPPELRLPEGLAIPPAAAAALLETPRDGVSGPTLGDDPEARAFIEAHTAAFGVDD